MMYQAFNLQSDLAGHTRAWGRVIHDAVSPSAQTGLGEPGMLWSAGARMMMRAGLTFSCPPLRH